MQIKVYGNKDQTYHFYPVNKLAQCLLTVMKRRSFMKWQLEELETWFEVIYVGADN